MTPAVAPAVVERGEPRPPWLQFTLKVASRCNIACTYCYVYETGDDSWRRRPKLMSDETFDATLERIVEHASAADQKALDVVFHGGEPTLLGPERFLRWCRRIEEIRRPDQTVRLAIQTNATLVDETWAAVFRVANVTVGVSLDGPPEVNDRLRVDHLGRGTHDRVARGIANLKAAGVPIHLLSVIPFGVDPIVSYDHLASFEPQSIAYLMPDQTHDTIGRVRDVFGPTPCADFLLPILDRWWSTAPAQLTVQPFKEMARAILGGRPRVDFIGNNPYNYVFVETDGTMEGLDVLRICGPDAPRTGLDVKRHRFVDVFERSDLHRRLILEGLPLPTDCRSCPEATTCGGGYVPHRYEKSSGFDHPSAWCADLKLVFARLRELLDVSPEETLWRARALAEVTDPSFEVLRNAPQAADFG